MCLVSYEIHSLQRAPFIHFGSYGMNNVYLIVALGAVAAGFVQGLSGFAFAVVAMSIWVWFLDPKLAAALALFGALTGQIISAIQVRRGFHWPTLLPFVMGGLLGIPLGVAILPLLDLQVFKALLGAFLVLWCPFILLAKGLPRVGWGGKGADALAGAIGGVMGGIGGFTGPVPTLWCTLRQLPKDEQRVIIQNFNLATQVVTAGIYVQQGLVTRSMLPMLGTVAAAMLLPTLLGARLYAGISELRFRQLVLGLLTASGVALLASALPHLPKAL